MASKNNPAHRKGEITEKTYEGKKVKPVMYVGTHVGHGKYMAAQEEGGKMVADQDGRPIPYSQI